MKYSNIENVVQTMKMVHWENYSKNNQRCLERFFILQKILDTRSNTNVWLDKIDSLIESFFWRIQDKVLRKQTNEPLIKSTLRKTLSVYCNPQVWMEVLVKYCQTQLRVKNIYRTRKCWFLTCLTDSVGESYRLW